MNELSLVLDAVTGVPSPDADGPGQRPAARRVDLDELAEEIECGRYENMAKVRWRDLRDGERQTRTALMRRTLDTAGVGRFMHELQARADRSDDLARQVVRAGEQLAGERADHAATAARLSGRVAALESELADVRAALAQAQERAQHADATIAAVVRALGSAG